MSTVRDAQNKMFQAMLQSSFFGMHGSDLEEKMGEIAEAVCKENGVKYGSGVILSDGIELGEESGRLFAEFCAELRTMTKHTLKEVLRKKAELDKMVLQCRGTTQEFVWKCKHKLEEVNKAICKENNLEYSPEAMNSLPLTAILGTESQPIFDQLLDDWFVHTGKP